jgi:hypothetical protein
MRAKTLFSLVVAIALVLSATLAATTIKPPVQASRITFTEVTRVCGHYLMGTYVVVHDDRKMADGEPCTTFYRLRPGAAAEPVLSFHCIPRQRPMAAQTTIVTAPTGGVTTTTHAVDLIEYQIAGDSEAHGIPATDVQVTNR